MSTSGNYNYNNTTSNIITTSLQIIQQYGANETVSSPDYNYALVLLNQIAKFLPANAGFLWKRQIGYIFLNSTQNQYNLGNVTGPDYATDNYNYSTLTNATIANSNQVTVNSIVGFANQNYIGIVNNDASMFWTTIANVPTGNTITLTTANPVSVNSGQNVYTYQTQMAPPLKILRAFRREYQSDGNFSDIVIRKASLLDYVRLPNKTEGNAVLEFVYSRKLNPGLLYTWPIENSGKAIMGIVYDQQVQDFVNTTDNPDFPQYWLLPLSYILAYYLAPAYGIIGELRQEIKADMNELLSLALSYDADDENTKIEIDTMGNGGV